MYSLCFTYVLRYLNYESHLIKHVLIPRRNA